jgi:DNA repair exonuclease SbcCD nuclease subunit
MTTRDLRLVHSSDLHVDDDYTARLYGGDGTAGLAGVIAAARDNAADLLLLAGDTFDCNRVPARLVERTAALLAAADLPVIILPGNHDPAVADSPYRAPCFARPNLFVLGISHAERLHFPALDLELWGRAHRDYDDMVPLANPPPRRARWRVALAHGHYEPLPDRSTPLRPSWLIGDAELAAAGADYVALGHWNRAVRIGGAGCEAWYSGSPDYAGSVNLVRLGAAGVSVSQLALPAALRRAAG